MTERVILASPPPSIDWLTAITMSTRSIPDACKPRDIYDLFSGPAEIHRRMCGASPPGAVLVHHAGIHHDRATSSESSMALTADGSGAYAVRDPR